MSGSDDSDDLPSKGERRILLGRAHQVEIPDFGGIKEFSEEKSILIWRPSDHVAQQKLEDYISLAKEQYKYSAEQALGMLLGHEHDIETATNDLENFTPCEDDWKDEDKLLFEIAFKNHGKRFSDYKRLLPDKSIAMLVKYYYSWKKTRQHSSEIDRKISDLHSRNKGKQPLKEDDATCHHCGVKSNRLEITPKGDLCIPCHKYYENTGVVRRGFRIRNKAPRGMYISSDDLHSMTTGPSSQPDAILKHMDDDITNRKRQVQSNKQTISAAKVKFMAILEKYRQCKVDVKVTCKWSNEETMLAVEGVRRFGKDFSAIADVIGSKTEQQVQVFFVMNYRRRYNLDSVLSEWEKNNSAS